MDPARLVGLLYKLFSVITFWGGVVAVLLHLRREGRAKVEVCSERHALGVFILICWRR